MNANVLRLQYARRYKDKQVPLMGMFEITGRCNFNCKMCYVHTKPNEEFQKTEKTGDWWISMIDAACERGMLFATLTGGECFLHPDFKRIYMHLVQKGLFIQLNTNGFLLNEKNIEFLKANPPLEIQITLYGADDAAYERVTGAPAYHRVVENLKLAREAGLNVKVTLTPSSFAPGETARIVEYLKREQIPYGINESLVTPYSDSDTRAKSEFEVTVEEKIQYLRLQNGVEPQPIPEETLPPVGGGETEPIKGIKCTAGRVAFVISHEGEMMPCTSMYYLRVPMKGPEDFDQAWAQMLNEGSNFLIPIECEGCAYKTACPSCPIIRAGGVGKGHCDPAVCELTRRLVAAGVKKLKRPE